MSEVIKDKYWERKPYVVSEFKIDAKWVLRKYDDKNDPPKAWGSLRIVSHPNLPPGYLRAISILVTSRRPKTQEEIEDALNEYQMSEDELEVYSIDEHLETVKFEHEAPKRELEELFDVKIFQK